MTTAGEKIDSIALPSIADPKAVVWLGDNTFGIGSEGDGSVI